MDRSRGLEGIEYEIAGERAASIGRCAARMEEALAALRAFDGRGGAPARDDLLAEAAERVWFYVVQRESLGWYDHDQAIALYEIPAEVLARLGPRRVPTPR